LICEGRRNQTKAAIHLPKFLPYPSFFNKLSLADAWIVMEETQYGEYTAGQGRKLASLVS